MNIDDDLNEIVVSLTKAFPVEIGQEKVEEETYKSVVGVNVNDVSERHARQDEGCEHLARVTGQIFCVWGLACALDLQHINTLTAKISFTTIIKIYIKIKRIIYTFLFACFSNL